MTSTVSSLLRALLDGDRFTAYDKAVELCHKLGDHHPDPTDLTAMLCALLSEELQRRWITPPPRH